MRKHHSIGGCFPRIHPVVGAALWWFVGGARAAAATTPLRRHASRRAAEQGDDRGALRNDAQHQRRSDRPTNDRGAYCEALDKIRSDMKLAP
jgi:hypothetical protein